VYHAVAGQEMPHEPIYCAGLICGNKDQESWCQQEVSTDFYDAKGIVENLFEQLQIRGVRWAAEEPEPFYHPGKCCRIMVGNTVIGSIGEMHPKVLQKYEIEHAAYYFELNFEDLVRLAGNRKTIVAPSRFPDSVRDLALLAPLELASAQLIDCVKSLKLQELEKVAIFDLYQGDRVPEGYKSIALRLRYRAAERTMTDDEVQLVHQKVIGALTGKLGVTVR